MARPADLTDSETGDSDVEYWYSHGPQFSGSDTDSEKLYTWRRPNTYRLVPKFRELIRDYPDGLPLADFLSAYNKKFHEELDCTIYGYKTFKDLIMDYSDVIECIRQGTDPDGWLAIDATRPPTEEERTTFSMKLNPELVMEIKNNIAQVVAHYLEHKEFDYRIGLPLEQLQMVYEEQHGGLIRFEILGFDSLKSLCFAFEGEGFKMCQIDHHYLLMPPANPWHCPEIQEPQEPVPEDPEQERVVVPKDMAGPEATLFHLDYPLFLKPNHMIEIVVEKHKSPGEFFFRLKEFDKMLRVFKKGLVKFYGTDSNFRMPVQMMRPGQVCAVSSYDPRHPGLWERGVILNANAGGRVNVFLVDTGGVCTVYANRVKFLHKHFLPLPVQAIPGSLAGVVPAGGEFDEASNSLFQEHLRLYGLDAEVYMPDYIKPFIPLIIFKHSAVHSLNRMLLDQANNTLDPSVPFCILTRANLPNPFRAKERKRRDHDFWQKNWVPAREAFHCDTDSEEEEMEALEEAMELEDYLAGRRYDVYYCTVEPDQGNFALPVPAAGPSASPPSTSPPAAPLPTEPPTAPPEDELCGTIKHYISFGSPTTDESQTEIPQWTEGPPVKIEVAEEMITGEKPTNKKNWFKLETRTKVIEKSDPILGQKLRNRWAEDPRLQEMIKNWNTDPEEKKTSGRSCVIDINTICSSLLDGVKKENENSEPNESSSTKPRISISFPKKGEEGKNEKLTTKIISALGSEISVSFPDSWKTATKNDDARITVSIRGRARNEQQAPRAEDKMERSKNEEENAAKDFENYREPKYYETDSESDTNESQAVNCENEGTDAQKHPEKSETSHTDDKANTSDKAANEKHAGPKVFKFGKKLSPEKEKELKKLFHTITTREMTEKEIREGMDLTRKWAEEKFRADSPHSFKCFSLTGETSSNDAGGYTSTISCKGRLPVEVTSAQDNEKKDDEIDKKNADEDAHKITQNEEEEAPEMEKSNTPPETPKGEGQ